MKSKKKLLDFINYCFNHPEDRFWQALRNWSGYHFILAWRPNKPITLHEDGGNDVEGLAEMSEKFGVEDTFYWE